MTYTIFRLQYTQLYIYTFFRCTTHFNIMQRKGKIGLVAIQAKKKIPIQIYTHMISDTPPKETRTKRIKL